MARNIKKVSTDKYEVIEERVTTIDRKQLMKDVNDLEATLDEKRRTSGILKVERELEEKRALLAEVNAVKK